MMKERIKSATVILGALLVIFLMRYFWDYAFDIFWLAIVVLSVGELIKLSQRTKSPCYKLVNYVYPFMFAGVLLLGLLVQLKTYEIILLEMIVLVLLMLSLIFIPLINKKHIKLDNTQFLNVNDYIISRALSTSYILLYPTILLCFVFILNHISDFGIIAQTYSNNYNGMFAVLFILAISMATDTMAMLVGKLLKGKKLCPSISFNKTISGFIGGLIFGTIASVLMYLLFTAVPSVNEMFVSSNATWWQFAIIGFIGATANSFGDLFGSYIKRRFFVKDFANVFPGHGGFMDRLNGVCFVAPIITICFILLF